MLNQEEIERVNQFVLDSFRESGAHLGILKKVRERFGDEAVKVGLSAMEAWTRTPEGQESRQGMEASFQAEIMEKEWIRRESKEQREREWQMAHAYRWMMDPVPVWYEDEEREEGESSS